MPITRYRDTSFSLNDLISRIRRGEVALPEIQRPFVWSPTKVRDLLDSMYKGFPVGNLLFWCMGVQGYRQIGVGAREAAPHLLVVDGQQRLTALYAILTGAPVIRKDRTEGRIRIAFHPADQRFAVTDAAVENDASYIPDVTKIWEDYRQTTESFLDRLRTQRGEEGITRDEERDLEAAIDRVRDLQHYPFKAVELDTKLDDELVAEIFVRINSKGVQLKQADFILTLMSLFNEAGRKELETFSQSAKEPSPGTPSAYNHFIVPKPDQLLRVAVGLAFRRGRLVTVYSILRGKDLETKEYSPERRDQQFAILAEAQAEALDLINWHEFLGALRDAGYRSARMITSETAILYSYVLYLIGRRDYGVDRMGLRRTIGRWFFMAHTTGRYTSSPESAFESDVRRIQAVPLGDADAFCGALDREVSTVFTNDYWSITLPNRLSSSSAKSPAGVAYWAALNLLDAEVLFSTAKVASRLDPSIVTVRDMERHHLFPKKYLETLGIRRAGQTNQVANMAFVEWPDNTAISNRAPSDYWPAFSARLSPEKLRKHLYWHALPVGWEQLDYEEFLHKRRQKIAEVVRDGFKVLFEDHGSAEASAGPRAVSQLIADGESMTVEFKSTARWNVRASQADKKMEQVILKTVAGFMNSEGGTLLIGVSDQGDVLGLEADYATLGAKGDRDGYELFLTQLFQAHLRGTACSLVRIGFDSVAGRDVCRVSVAASARPVFVKPLNGREPTDFWVRTGNSTRQLVGSDMTEYHRDHWA